MGANQLYIEPAYQDLFAAHDLTDFDAIMTCATRRSTSRHRTRDTAPFVLEGAGQAHEFYLKRVYRVPWKHIIVDALRRRVPCAQPVREFRAAQRLAERGIGVMRPVAWGQKTFLGLPRQAFLIVEAVSWSETLVLALARLLSAPPNRPDAVRGRHDLLRELGAFVRCLHDARFSFPDLVGKHIFVERRTTPESSRRWQFCLIDVERLASTTDPRRHRRQMRRLLESLEPLPLSSRDLLRFAYGYLHLTSRTRADRKATLRREFGWASECFAQVFHRAVTRPRQPPELIARIDEQIVTTGRIAVNERYLSVLQKQGLGTIRGVFEFNRGRRLHKEGLPAWRSRMELTLRDPDGARRRLYLKRYDRPPLGQQLRRLLSPGRQHGTAWWEWRSTQSLSQAGVPTMVPVAFGEKMRGMLERRSFLVTEAVPGPSLEAWVPRNLPGTEMPAFHQRKYLVLRRRLARELARLAAALHMRGLVHRDFYLCHVFIELDDQDRPMLRLIDLARVFRPRFRRWRWRIKDLAALNASTPPAHVTRTDRLRFLRTYMQISRLDRRTKTLARAVERRTQRIATRVGAVASTSASKPATSAARAASTP